MNTNNVVIQPGNNRKYFRATEAFGVNIENNADRANTSAQRNTMNISRGRNSRRRISAWIHTYLEAQRQTTKVGTFTAGKVPNCRHGRSTRRRGTNNSKRNTNWHSTLKYWTVKRHTIMRLHLDIRCACRHKERRGSPDQHGHGERVERQKTNKIGTFTAGPEFTQVQLTLGVHG